VKVVLNDAEQRLARFIAQRRNQLCEEKGLKDSSFRESAKGETIHLEGAGAELAFCKVFNLYPELEMNWSDKDVVLHCGITADIKSTKYLSGHLITPLWKTEKSCDIYVLLVGAFPEYEIVGFATKEQLFSSIKDFGRGDTFALAQRELCKI